MDTMMLAEAASTEDLWLEQTLQLLEALDEDDMGPLDEEWLEELKWLDELELGASS